MGGVGTMGALGREHRRTILRALIVALVIINGFIGGTVADAHREAVSGLLPQSAIEVHPEVLLDWEGTYPRARVLKRETITEESYGSDGRLSYAVAAFNPKDQAITLSSMFAELDGTTQDSTLRHEYGHALMSDIVARDEGGDYADSRVRTNTLQLLTQENDPRELPELLLPVFEDYQRSPRSIYDEGRTQPGYYTSTFGEFFAESYRRHLEGKPLPASTEAVIDRIEALDR